ncbi:MAG: aminoglycoside/hydroxyurea antibiotic resistance kinase [Caldilineaceae bacterium]|nr:aminoglycoside/hydroxyurea antibiotic resistance kinase [Caldilineaceae bacterium]
MQLPSDFIHTVTLTFPAGAAWLDALPALLDEYAAALGLTLEPPFPLSYNYVAPARRSDGTRVVLKLGVPNPELTTEILALTRYAGNGAVRLLASDAERGMLLLERLLPGTPLAALDDDAAATEQAALLMRRLWRPTEAGHPFHTVAAWGGRGMAGLRTTFNGGTGPFPVDLVILAEEMFAAAHTGEQILLHGDLHHENILNATRGGWLAIDPKGVAGPRGYECGAFLRNQLFNRPDPAWTLAQRVARLAEILDLPHAEILRWGIAQNVLSAWWNYGPDALNTIQDDAGLMCARLCAAELGFG